MKHILLFTFIILLSVYTVDCKFLTRIGSAGNDVGTDLTVDILGDNIAVGYFTGSVSIGSGTNKITLNSNGSTDIYVASWDLTGTFQWAFSIGGTGEDIPYAVSADYLGNIIITGSFSNAVDFDPSGKTTPAQSKGGKDIFVAKYDNKGNFQWVRTFGSTGDDEGISLATTDYDGNLFLTGYFSLTTDFNTPGTSDASAILASKGGKDIFVLCLSDSGNLQYVYGFGGIGDDLGKAIKPIGNSGICLGGYFSGTVNFGTINTQNLTSAGGTDIFLVRYDNMVLQWANRFGASGDDHLSPGALVIDDEDNILIAGDFAGTMNINPNGTINLTGNGMQDGFIAKYDKSGNYQWAFSIGSINNDAINSIGLDQLNDVFICGYYAGQADFNPDPNQQFFLTPYGSSGNQNGFIARYTSEGKFIWADGYGNDGSTTVSSGLFNSLFTDLDGTTSVTGGFFDNTVFDCQDGKDSLNSAGNSDAFVMQLTPDGKLGLDTNSNPSKYVKITVPAGGESWKESTVQKIKWTSQNVVSVKLDYQTSSTSGWKSIASGIPASAGSYDWNLPMVTSTECFVRITSMTDNTVSDTSGKFTIEKNDFVDEQQESSNINTTMPTIVMGFATINVNLKKDGNLKIEVIDITGTKIILLENNYKQAGDYYYNFNSLDYSNGVYLLRINFDNQVIIRKFVVGK